MDNACHQEYDNNAFQLAKRVAADGDGPDPVWMVDICQTADNLYHLLEIGGFSFSDLYAGNKIDIVRAVSDVAASIWRKQAA